MRVLLGLARPRPSCAASRGRRCGRRTPWASTRLRTRDRSRPSPSRTPPDPRSHLRPCGSGCRRCRSTRRCPGRTNPSPNHSITSISAPLSRHGGLHPERAVLAARLLELDACRGDAVLVVEPALRSDVAVEPVEGRLLDALAVDECARVIAAGVVDDAEGQHATADLRLLAGPSSSSAGSGPRSPWYRWSHGAASAVPENSSERIGVPQASVRTARGGHLSERGRVSGRRRGTSPGATRGARYVDGEQRASGRVLVGDREGDPLLAVQELEVRPTTRRRPVRTRR